MSGSCRRAKRVSNFNISCVPLDAYEYMYYYTYINLATMKNIGHIFASLSDPTRRIILENLRGEDLTPSELLERIDVSQPTLSHHLDILKRAELIEGRREGQFIRYSLNMTVFEMGLQYMVSIRRKRK